MAVELAVSGRAKAGRVRRAVVGLLVALGLLASGAGVTFVVAIYGGPIERFLAPGYQRISGQAGRVATGAGVTSKLITQTAVFGRSAINVEPPDISDHDIDAVFNPEWTDSYVDPLLEHRKTVRRADGSIESWEFAPGDTLNHRVVYAYRSGWPMNAMRGVLTGINVNTFPAVPTAYWVRRGIAPGSEEMPQIVMPLGFAVNTVFFAVVMGAVVFVPLWSFRYFRREVRRVRVQCVVCGYKLKSRVALCPECGHKAPRTW